MNATASILPKDAHENWLPTLQLAGQEVFELMLASRLEIPSTPIDEKGLDLTSMVGLAGRLCGVLTVRCSSESAALMACRMLGVEADAARQAMCDAAGEICNMVAGNFKNKISGLGDGCMLSVPTVITGEDYCLHSLGSDGVVQTTMLFEGEPVVLSLEIHG
jgi:chemotaxis protein CheX